MSGLPALPARVVVGANGAYWRDYGDHYSMCPVSEDNDPVTVAAVYVLDEVTGPIPALEANPAPDLDAKVIAKVVTDDLARYFGRQPKYRRWSGKELAMMLSELNADPGLIAARLGIPPDSAWAPPPILTDSQLIAFAAVIRAAEFGEFDNCDADDGDAFVLTTARRLGIHWSGER